MNGPIEGPIRFPERILAELGPWEVDCEHLSVRFSPDGSQLLSSSNGDNALSVWDVASGRAVRVLYGEENVVFGIAFDESGRRIASGSRYEGVRIWDLERGAPTWRLDYAPSQIWRVAFVQDGRQLLTCAEDGTVRSWDVETRDELWRVKFLYDARAFSLTADRKHVLAIPSSCEGARSSPALIDVTDGRVVRQFELPPADLFDVSCAREGNLAAIAATRSVYLVDIATGAVVREIKAHRSSVFSVAFAPDASFLVSGGKDKRVKVWSTTTGKQLHSFDAQTMVLSVDVSVRGLIAACGDGVVRVWDPKRTSEPVPKPTLDRYAGRILGLAFDADGVWSGDALGRVRLWDPETGSVRRTFTSEAPIVRFAQRSGRFATVDTRGSLTVRDGVRAERIWAAKDLAKVDFIAFDGAGRLVVVADERVRVYEHGGELSRSYAVPDIVDNYPVASLDARLLVYPTSSEHHAIIDVETGESHGRLPRLDGLVVTNNGERLFGNVSAWEKRPGTLFCVDRNGAFTERTHAVRAAGLLAVDAEGRYAIVNQHYGALELWDLRADRFVAHLRHGHLAEVTVAAISRDGRWAVSGDDAGRLALWAMPDADGRFASPTGWTMRLANRRWIARSTERSVAFGDV